MDRDVVWRHDCALNVRELYEETECPVCGYQEDEPTYFSRAWHYPDGWTAEQVVRHALSFALADYERLSSQQAHPLTQGQAAIRDALEALNAERPDPPVASDR